MDEKNPYFYEKKEKEKEKTARIVRWQGVKSSNDDVNQPPSEMVTIGNAVHSEWGLVGTGMKRKWRTGYGMLVVFTCEGEKSRWENEDEGRYLCCLRQIGFTPF